MSQVYANRPAADSVIRLSCRLEQEVTAPFDARTALTLQVWQARHGMIVTVADVDGRNWRARIVELNAEGGIVMPFQPLARPPESPLSLTVYQAVPEKERFELILEKLTELGVQRIVPVITSRSSTITERDTRQQKSHRWPEVLRRAACQCRRASIPQLSPCLDLSDVLIEAQSVDLRLLLYEGEGVDPIRQILTTSEARSVALLVGPEGGLSRSEVETARRHHFCPVSLGPRILRTETAAISAAAVIQFALGDLY